MPVNLPISPSEPVVHSHGPSSPQRLLKRLVVPTALAVSALALASSANAAECVNGYRMLGNQVIVLCDEATEAHALFQPGAPPAEAPATNTGSTAPRGTGRVMVDSIEDCRPGAYWTYYLDSGEVSLACR